MSGPKSNSASKNASRSNATGKNTTKSNGRGGAYHKSNSTREDTYKSHGTHGVATTDTLESPRPLGLKVTLPRTVGPLPAHTLYCLLKEIKATVKSEVFVNNFAFPP